MSELDYAEVARSILKERPEGYTVERIRVNFDLMEHDIPKRIQERCCSVFEEKASYYLNGDIHVAPDNSISELWSCDLFHSPCGQAPHYDSLNDEYYCPICSADSDSVFDY